MAGAIKRFFEKRKLDAKFKLAGGGHSLTDSAPRSSHAQQQRATATVSPPQPKSQAAAIAGDAALSRYQNATRPTESRSAQAIKSEARRQLESESADKARSSTPSSAGAAGGRDLEYSSHLAVQGVFFTCPFIGDGEVFLPREELLAQLKEYLLTVYPDDPLYIAATMIKTLTRVRSAVDGCLEVLRKYLQNLIDHPTEEKYRRIRTSNKVYQEKVASVCGASHFLQAAGFQQETADGEQFMVLPSEKCDSAAIAHALEVLNGTEKIPLNLHRDLRIFSPPKDSRQNSQLAKAPNLPEDFFVKTLEELKLEQAQKSVEVERMMQLRTKEMRERDQQKALYRYRYILVRVRFPDHFTLQGTFKSTEKLADLEQFVRDCIELEWAPFQLIDGQGQRLEPGEITVTLETEAGAASVAKRPKTLAELGLAPSALLNFNWDPELLKDLNANGQANTFLKRSLLAYAQAF